MNLYLFVLPSHSHQVVLSKLQVNMYVLIFECVYKKSDNSVGVFAGSFDATTSKDDLIILQ